ncbi:MAG TPA: methionine--tRNA ligase [Candidatus Thermoplasmatota archaeon]|nr:methionine--tRNA ligase [Candidatus Thermoplasmatota archaeon]
MQKENPGKPPVYIGVAWPYANGPLHLGHIAGSLLPPDIFRRAMKMQGHPVLMVSGSDCHGTPIMIKAEKEGKTPAEVVAHYHADHARALERLGIGFDLFTTTTTANHQKVVQEIFLAAREMGYIEERTQKAPYDAKAGRFLPDRYVEGTCPHCGRTDARGDQCDGCGKTLDPQDLKDPRSKLDPGNPITFRDTKHFFFLLSKLQPELEKYVAKTAGHWRANTINFTQNWLKEGLQDRAITRDLTWGIPIPLPGYEDKRIYVWFEAVCGYLTASLEWAQKQGKPNEWEKYWTDPKAHGYYFLGKDNIPFHTIIWPAILLAYNEKRAKSGQKPLDLPFDVPANEFLNLAGKQFSKSRGVSIAVHDILDRFQADAVRYYLSINMPEGRDSDWVWEDFLAKVNDELVGTLGNLAQRVVSFAAQNLGTIPPEPAPGHALSKKVAEALEACGQEMELHLRSVQLRPGIRRLMALAAQGNQWMQEAKPWATIKTDPKAAADDLHALLRLVRGLSVLMAPYLPTAAQQLWETLGEAGSVHDQPWSAATQQVKAGAKLDAPKVLFRKLEAKDIPQEAIAATPTNPQMAQIPQSPATSGSSAKSVVPAGAGDPKVTIEEFQRIHLRLAEVTSVVVHPKADKLYVIRLNAGDLGERQVVAGLKAHYKPEELVGKTVAFVANLQPAMLRGVESQGMILAGDDGTTVAVLEPQRKLPPGSKIR